jgi:hypothetical protein
MIAPVLVAEGLMAAALSERPAGARSQKKENGDESHDSVAAQVHVHAAGPQHGHLVNIVDTPLALG